MENNTYEPPKANLEIESIHDSKYYVVSSKKFLTLFIATLGTYTIYWFYKNWWHHKFSTGSKTWPVMRGLFSIFFAHSLFRNVNQTLEEKDIEYHWNHKSYATIYVICSIITNISDRMSSQNIGSPITDLLSLGLTGVTGWILFKAQHAINIACDDAQGYSNSEFSAANIIWIVLGILLWALILIGMTSFINTPIQ